MATDIHPSGRRNQMLSIKAGLSYQDHIANVKTTGSEFLDGAIIQPATKSWDSFKVIGESAVDSVVDSSQDRNDKKFDSGYDFVNYLTLGLPDGVVGIGGESFDQRYQTFKHDTTTASFLNYATMGPSEMVVNAVAPEEAWSPEHWLNSLGSASVLATGGLGSTSSHLVKKSTLSSPKPPAIIPKVQKPWTVNAALNWLNDFIPKVYVVHDSLGGNHYVFSWRGSGGKGGKY